MEIFQGYMSLSKVHIEPSTSSTAARVKRSLDDTDNTNNQSGSGDAVSMETECPDTAANQMEDNKKNKTQSSSGTVTILNFVFLTCHHLASLQIFVIILLLN